jgi:hypothetical protein
MQSLGESASDMAAGGSPEDAAKKIVLETVMGGATGGAATVAGGAAKSVAKKILDRSADKGLDTVGKFIKREIIGRLNDGKMSTPLARAQLERAEKNVVNEVVSGPDAKEISKAVSSFTKPKDALPVVQSVIEKVDAANEEAYEAFRRAGRGRVSTAQLLERIDNQIKDAARDGNTFVSAALKGLKDDVIEIAADAGEKIGKDGRPLYIALPTLRGMITQIGHKASNALGGLEKGARAKNESLYMMRTLDIMKETMDAQAGKVAVLQDAAKEIGERNARLNGLLTIRKNLDQRIEREAGDLPGLVRGATLGQRALQGGAVGGTLATLSQLGGASPGAALGGLAVGAVGASLVPTAKLAERVRARAAIRRAQGAAPVVSKEALELATKVLSGSARSVARNRQEENP